LGFFCVFVTVVAHEDGGPTGNASQMCSRVSQHCVDTISKLVAQAMAMEMARVKTENSRLLKEVAQLKNSTPNFMRASRSSLLKAGTSAPAHLLAERAIALWNRVVSWNHTSGSWQRPAWIDEKVKTIPASINQVCAPFIKADLRLADSLHQCEKEGGNANCLNKTFVGCGQTKNCRWGRKGSQTGHLYNNKAGIPSSQCNCTDGNYKSLMSMSKHSNRQREIGRFLDIANQVLLFADFMSFFACT